MSSFSQHLDALLLALASSTDNFAVGFSIGIGRNNLPLWVNAAISFCNGLGAFLAGYGGSLLNENLPFFAPSLAAIVFGTLGVQELFSYTQGSDANTESVLSNIPLVLRLAVPMTLNNLAGGAAGGAVGLTPGISGLYALMASFLTMYIGHFIGYRVGAQKIAIHPSLVSGLLLLALCVLTILEMLQT